MVRAGKLAAYLVTAAICIAAYPFSGAAAAPPGPTTGATDGGFDPPE